MAEPTIDPDKVSFIIEKAQEFDAPEGLPIDEEEVTSGPDAISPGAKAYGPALTTSVEFDDLAQRRIDDPAFVEARSQINSMNIDEQCELVALAWVGRGDYAADEWDEALRIANQEHNSRTAEYLFGMPHLPDHLQAGLDALEIGAGEA
jgi:hypothetical protein